MAKKQDEDFQVVCCCPGLTVEVASPATATSPLPMYRYETSLPCGEGAYGIVLKATLRETGDTVAIKKLTYTKFHSFDECVLLREVQALRRLRHQNIVKLKELIREQDVLYMVLEYVDTTLDRWLRDQSMPPHEASVQTIACKLMNGLKYMHAQGFVHRDIKPQNILVSHDLKDLKLCDFGIARKTRSATEKELTEYVTTRWYRAPEILLHSPAYSLPVDIWAAAAIIAECFTRQPIFPGQSEADQLERITKILGKPHESSIHGGSAWKQGHTLMNARGGSFLECGPIALGQLVPTASNSALDLLASTLRWDPSRRLTASQSLRHAFLRSSPWRDHTPPPVRPMPSGHSDNTGAEEADDSSPHANSPSLLRSALVSWARKRVSRLSGSPGSPGSAHAADPDTQQHSKVPYFTDPDASQHSSVGDPDAIFHPYTDDFEA